MQGKVTEVMSKRQELSVDGKIYRLTNNAWVYAQRLKEGDVIEFTVTNLGGYENISFFKKLGPVETSTNPIYRRKGSFYIEKNDDQILRENVLRTAVMWAEIKKEDVPNMDLKGLFGIAALMEKAIKEGFDKVMGGS